MADAKTCRGCGGTGKQSVRCHRQHLKSGPACSKCGDTGRIYHLCTDCGGSGRV